MYLNITVFISFLCNYLLFIKCRKKRAIDFQQELDYCDPKECTLIQCKVGPMAKDDVLTFKIRSRLFTETQIRVRNKFEILFHLLYNQSKFMSFDD